MEKDFDILKDVFEMAEVLTNELDESLEILTYNETTGKSCNVVFVFGPTGELTNVYTED